jgi:hypothetical protein
MCEVLVSSLSSEDEESSNSGVGENRERRESPNERVSDQVDLSVIFDPAVIVFAW